MNEFLDNVEKFLNDHVAITSGIIFFIFLFAIGMVSTFFHRK